MGGIKSEHGIPMSARNLHPSHFGFIDPVRTTESLRVGIGDNEQPTTLHLKTVISTVNS